MQNPKSNAGFTLLELMVTVSIIIIMAAAAAVPGFIGSMADNRASNLAEDLIRLGRRAKAEPIGTGRAHRLVYTQVNSLGILTLFGGDSNQCNLVANWGTAIDSVDAQDYTQSGAPATVQLISFAPENTELSNIEICYQPSGGSLIRNNAGSRFNESISTTDGITSDVIFNITRTLESLPRGVTRYIIFPYGGSARIYRPTTPTGGSGG